MALSRMMKERTTEMGGIRVDVWKCLESFQVRFSCNSAPDCLRIGFKKLMLFKLNVYLATHLF